jgi:hypothetical protein
MRIRRNESVNTRACDLTELYSFQYKLCMHSMRFTKVAYMFFSHPLRNDNPFLIALNLKYEYTSQI